MVKYVLNIFNLYVKIFTTEDIKESLMEKKDIEKRLTDNLEIINDLWRSL